jgi:anti-sigma factor RsiW
VSAVPPGPSHAEIQSLLGAYALDATEPEETALVEEHLRTCVRCATEVAHHHEVAGLLANSGGEAPDHLWVGIADHLEGGEPPSWSRLAARLDEGVDQGAPEAERVVPIARARRRRLASVTGGVVAAAAVVVAVVLGVEVAHLHNQLQTPALTRAEQAALAAPSTRQVHLTTPAGGAASGSATVVLTASGTGFVEAGRLTPLPTGRTYQLWGVVSGRTISLGLLGRSPAVVPFSAAGHGGMQAFAISAENAGGSVAPTSTPVVEGTVSA